MFEQMLMKKMVMMLFGAMFALGASAQAGVAGYQVDSMVTMIKGDRASKTVYEYNSAGLVTAEYSYSCLNIQKKDSLIGRNLYFYNENNKPTSDETYDYEDGKYVLTGRSEVVKYNEENGQPCETIVYEKDAESSSEELQPVRRVIIHKFHNFCDEDEETYELQNGEWVLVMTNHYEFDEWDNKIKGIAQALMEGMQVNMEMSWTYDSHHNVTSSTTTTTVMGMEMKTSNTYTNTYDSNDCLIEQVTTTESQDAFTTYYYWSPASTSGIDSLRSDSRKDLNSSVYDLQGRKVNLSTARKGIYVVGGKKIVVKK